MSRKLPNYFLRMTSYFSGIKKIWEYLTGSFQDFTLENRAFNMNGIGIPIEKQRQIFSARILATVGSDHEKGVGLGLLLCYDFTKAMNGHITFKSEEGKGTQFKVSLPKV